MLKCLMNFYLLCVTTLSTKSIVHSNLIAHVLYNITKLHKYMHTDICRDNGKQVVISTADICSFASECVHIDSWRLSLCFQERLKENQH